MQRMTLGTALLALAALTPAAARAQEAEVTANVGWVSEYYYRGIFQNTSSASAGLDVAFSNVSLGTWAADVGEGNEVDLYGSVGAETQGFSVSAGGTGYFYTGDFDNTYVEANFGAGYGPLSVGYSIGKYDANPDESGLEDSYGFLEVTLEYAGFYGTFGHFDNDFTGSYGEFGYGFSVADMDLSVAWILNDKDLSGLDDKTDNTLTFGLTKTFTLY